MPQVIKVADLSGKLLNLWVAIAQGYQLRRVDRELLAPEGSFLLDMQMHGWYVDKIEGDISCPLGVVSEEGSNFMLQEYSPSTNWCQGGPIIEQEEIELVPRANGEQWAAGIGFCVKGGDTALIAAMRCYVTSKLGEVVPLKPEMEIARHGNSNS